MNSPKATIALIYGFLLLWVYRTGDGEAWVFLIAFSLLLLGVAIGRANAD